MIRLLCAVMLAAPAAAQTRAAAPAEVRAVPGVPAVLAAPAALPAALPSAPALPALAAPSLTAAPPAAVPLAAPASVAAAAAAPRAALPARLTALSAGVKAAAAGLDAPGAGAGQAKNAGQALEDLLTGAKSAAAADGAAPATAEELDFAAAAGTELGRRADDLGAERGLKASRMTGADFVALVADAARAADAAPAPSPAAAAAARTVRASLVRVMAALMAPDRPAKESLPRALSVWQVFDQEMAVAAGKGTLAAVADDAALFASQVEASVAPAPAAAPAPALAPSKPRPEDPEGYAEVSVPGSVFGWKPIETSPGHGLAPVDWLIRRALSERRSPARAAGFDLAGAPRREDARAYFYGERHTDGGLIAANMARLAQDARPGKPLIVLVEGYTGWAMNGWEAAKYLSDRGMDPDALAEKGIGGKDLEVRGWDTIDGYGDSKHPLLQHHMDLLELNRLAHSDARGWSYYRDFARAAWTAAKGWFALWDAAIVRRNRDLDAAVAKAAADADQSGATVAVIAGSDHLMRSPRLGLFFPRLFRPAFRASLKAALGGRAYWASRPAETK